MSIIISINPIIIEGSNNETCLTASEIEQKYPNCKEKIRTKIRNEDVLIKALKKLGAENNVTIGSSPKTSIGSNIVFLKNEAGTFDILFMGLLLRGEAKTFRDNLEEEYGNLIQEYVYEKLKQNAEEKGMILENEEMQADQTIVLTYRI